MNKYLSKITIRHLLPKFIRVPLWGNRERWGLKFQPDDSCWKERLQIQNSVYSTHQRNGIGLVVNDAGYKIMSSIDMNNKIVLEIGAGDIRHIKQWNSKPEDYILADIDTGMMTKAQKCLEENGVSYRSLLIERDEIGLSLDSESVDVVISFYSLEHLYPLKDYLEEISRILKPGGILIGAIPSEGGLAWGIGRYLTTRRWYKKNTSIDPDKIICWEHPNFADFIVREMEDNFSKVDIEFWPFKWLPILDVNLVIRFTCKKI